MIKPCVQAARASFVLVWTLGPQLSAATEKPSAITDSVRTPVWVERASTRMPLARGTALQNHDRIITGGTGAAYVRLADGSAAAISANAQLTLNALDVGEEGVFTAALDLSQGSLRFTSGAIRSPYRQRAVNLRFGMITTGIRGTDVWGSVDGEKDRLCLLEGQIVVVHPRDQARQLTEPLSCYQASRQGDAAPTVGTHTARELAMWTASTSIRPTPPHSLAPISQARRKGGEHRGVDIATVDNPNEALTWYDRAKAAGFAARITPRASPRGGYDYTVAVHRRPNQTEANALAAPTGEAPEKPVLSVLPP